MYLASLERDFPDVPMVCITVGIYNFVAESYMCKDLTRLPVMKSCNGCTITNVRYGVTDPSTRCYDGQQFATCINIPFNTLRHYVSEDGELNIWELTRDVKDSGNNVLVLASNRFANNVELVRFAQIADKKPNKWDLTAYPMVFNEEKRYVELFFDAGYGEWKGSTTYSELMSYENMPLTPEEREIAWHSGSVVC